MTRTTLLACAPVGTVADKGQESSALASTSVATGKVCAAERERAARYGTSENKDEECRYEVDFRVITEGWGGVLVTSVI